MLKICFIFLFFFYLFTFVLDSKSELISFLVSFLKSLAVQWMFLKSSMGCLLIKQVNTQHGVG